MKVEGTPKTTGSAETKVDPARTDWGRSVERHAGVGRFNRSGYFGDVSPTALAIQPRPA